MRRQRAKYASRAASVETDNGAKTPPLPFPLPPATSAPAVEPIPVVEIPAIEPTHPKPASPASAPPQQPVNPEAVRTNHQPIAEAPAADGRSETAEAGSPTPPGAAPQQDQQQPGRRNRRRRNRRRNGQQGQDPNAQQSQQQQNQQQRQHHQHQQREQQPRHEEPEPPPQLFTVSGILEWRQGAEGRIRQFEDGVIEKPDDPYIPIELGQQYPLRQGQLVTATVGVRRPRRRRGRSGRTPSRPTVENVLLIEGLDPAEYARRTPFESLTALDPQPRMTLEYKGCPPACRLIDLFCPIGFGTRGLIVAPPKAGKTVLLQNIAYGIKHNHPQVELVALLIDERPEEVTDFRRNVPAQVLASSNDQDVDRHIALGIYAVERAKRMLEAGKDVVVLLDSITRLGRAFNNSRKYGGGGRTMSGGLDSRAMEVPKQLFGAARKAEQGGSLTIIASCLVDTGSRADQIIFEEFKGTGNMELILDRTIAERRLFPAINLAASGTRKEHLLMGEAELKTVTALRRRLINMPPPVQIEQLLAALNRYETNEQLVRG